MVRVHSLEVSTRRLGNEFFTDPKIGIAVSHAFHALGLGMPQKSSTTTTAATTAAGTTGSTTSGANHHAKGESDDAQSRAVHDAYLGST